MSGREPLSPSLPPEVWRRVLAGEPLALDVLRTVLNLEREERRRRETEHQRMSLPELWDAPFVLVEALRSLGLDPAVPTGNRIVVTCPACGQRRAWVYTSGGVPTVRCNRHGSCLGLEGRTVWALLVDRLGSKPGAMAELRRWAGKG